MNSGYDIMADVGITTTRFSSFVTFRLQINHNSRCFLRALITG